MTWIHLYRLTGLHLTSFSTFTTIIILSYFFYFRFQTTYCVTRKTEATTPIPTSVEPSSTYNKDTEQKVLFATYSLQSKNWCIPRPIHQA
jgi:hypothetical protein